MTPDRQYIPGLTGLRALAAFWIMLFHILTVIPSCGFLPGFVQSAIRHGYYGVDIFFIISGFVMMQAHGSMQTLNDYRSFLIRRFRRIYPVHIVVLLFMGLAVLAAPFFLITINHEYELYNFVQHVMMISAWEFPYLPTWNHYDWAVSTLWLCYLMFPLFLIMHRRLSWRMVIILGTLLLCVMPLVAYVFHYMHTIAYAMPRALSGFAIGIILFSLHKIQDEHLKNKIFFGFAFIAITFLLIQTGFKPDFMAVPLLAFMIFYSVENPRLSRFFDTRFLSYWGERSYSLYMVQFPIIMIFKKAFAPHGQLYNPGLIMLALVLCMFTAAWCVYECIEKRFMSQARLS